MWTSPYRSRLPSLIGVWVAALFIVAWLVLEGRNGALLRGERSTAAFSSVVGQQGERTFQSLSLTLAAVGDAHELTPHPPPNDPQFQQMMARRLKDVPFVRAIFIIGPDGSIIHDTDYPKTPNISLADRPYFQAHLRDPSIAVTFSKPVLSRSGTGWFLPVTHALKRQGGFGGVVVAAIQAEHFGEAFGRIGLTDDDSVALFHSDGTLVACHPPRPADVGKRFELPPAATQAAGDRASVWSRSGDGILPGERVVSCRGLTNVPFVLLVSRSRATVLEEWRRTAAGAAVAMLALSSLVGWVLVRLLREQAAREQDRQRRVQAEKLEAMGQLTAGISHDFGNTLNVVAMSAALLRRGPVDPSISDEALAGIDRAVSDGKGLIERLMSFARRRSLTLAPLRLDAWLQEVRPLLTQAAGSRVTLTTEAASPLPEVLCDVGQLDTAVVNLIVNARDAVAPSGRVDVRVFPCSQGAGPRPKAADAGAAFVCLSVQDNGPGMSAEVRRRALEPFYTTKGEAGTGLGLPQVYGFMEQLGGSMTLDSAPGGGTAVHLFVPAIPANAAYRP